MDGPPLNAWSLATDTALATLIRKSHIGADKCNPVSFPSPFFNPIFQGRTRNGSEVFRKGKREADYHYVIHHEREQPYSLTDLIKECISLNQLSEHNHTDCLSLSGSSFERGNQKEDHHIPDINTVTERQTVHT
jgi:hypothetical protein